MESPVEESQPNLAEDTSVSQVFVPPSIHQDDLLVGSSYTHYTCIPTLVDPSKDAAAGTECVLGVDEAGRGPVIGPMVYGAFYLPLELHQSLLADTHHFDDSKVLTPSVRANLMKATCTPGTDLYNACGWAISSLSARDIAAGMLQNGASYNLNAQAMDATIELIKKIIDSGVNVAEVYIDALGNTETYRKKLERIFPSTKIVVEKKADSLYPCVSAASVVAKVTRDVSCELLYDEVSKASASDEGVDEASWGSGYPSDARTISWLKSQMDSLFGWGPECRFSWSTVKDLMEAKAAGGIKVDWPVDEEVDTVRLTDFLISTSRPGQAASSQGESLRYWYGSKVGQNAF